MLRFIPLLLLAGFNSLTAQSNESFSFGGQSRTYIRYIPKNYKLGMKLPLVFVLHGFTQNASSIMGYSGFNTLADSNNFFVVYANGISNAWNTNSGFPGGSTADDVGFIGAIIDTMQQRYGIDPKRVYSCGFSAGGFMSHRLACELGNRIAAIAAVSGTMSDAAFKSCKPSRVIPVMQIHGTSDAVVSYGGGISNISVDNTLKFWTGQNQCAAVSKTISLPDKVSEGSTVERIEYAPCSAGTEVVHLKVNSGGHSWPGSSGSGLGNTNMDISASSEIWKFFNRFTLDGAVSIVSIQENPEFNMFPNPVSDELHVQWNADYTSFVLSVWDMQGRMIMSHTANGTASNLSTANLKPGGYILKVQGADGNFERLFIRE
ncbi:MAG: T9SS type A sorting domain-containing protein [Bacteroidetes bacterium]|nr:T9SS type A sorting domain-containing protein [Bacteroidota bacterium]